MKKNSKPNTKKAKTLTTKKPAPKLAKAKKR